VNSLVAALDTATLALSAVALASLIAGWTTTLTRDARIFLVTFLAVNLFHFTSNALEWGGVSAALDPYEDFVQMLEPLLLVFTVYTLIQERSRRELRDSRERYHLLFNAGNDAVFVHGYAGEDTPGRIVEVNDLACQLLGYSRAELLCMSPAEIIDDASRPNMAGTTRRILAEGSAVFERTLQCKDGEKVPVEISSRLFDLDGRRLLLSVARDLRTRKALEEQVRQAQRMESIGRLAGGIAHDFNNLLTVIRGYTDILLNRRGTDPATRSDLEEIHRAAERAADLTRQLLAFGRRQVMRPQVLDLRELVSRTEQMLRRLIGEHIRLTVDRARELGGVRADPVQLEQVLVNLAVNSRDAMPQGGELHIAVRDIDVGQPPQPAFAEIPPGPYVLLELSDTGVGMGPETLARIFEPFFTTKELGKGTGLGLATVYGIVKQSQGHIVARSRPGRGSAFQVLLPRIAGVPDPSESPAVAPEAPSGPLSGSVLVAEDEAPVRQLIRRTLEAAGLTVLDAADGDAALELCRDRPVDLLVTDLVMPGLSGRELAARLKRLRPRLRVLFISGYPRGSESPVEGDPAEGPLLQKPFSPQRLLSLTRALLHA
jgi:two-component system cell cycle sensor histidine kinase/response regulator CckA